MNSMGEVVELGSAVKNLKVGDRVVNPFPIACGNCLLCKEGLHSLCENSNPNRWMAEKFWGTRPAVSLAIRTWSAATPVVKPSTLAILTPMSARSSSERIER